MRQVSREGVEADRDQVSVVANHNLTSRTADADPATSPNPAIIERAIRPVVILFIFFPLSVLPSKGSRFSANFHLVISLRAIKVDYAKLVISGPDCARTQP